MKKKGVPSKDLTDSRKLCYLSPFANKGIDPGRQEVMYAVIETGGKQYKVAEGDVLRVELLHAAEGASVSFEKVLLVAQEGMVRVGDPVVAKARVTGKILGEERGPKVIHFRYRRRKDSRKKQGHRQDYHRVLIEKIKA